MTPNVPRRLRVEILGDLAVAGYFVMANWRDPRTSPEIHTSGGPLVITFDGSEDAMAELTRLLGIVCGYGGLLAASAKAWLALVERWRDQRPDTAAPGSAAG